MLEVKWGIMSLLLEPFNKTNKKTSHEQKKANDNQKKDRKIR